MLKRLILLVTISCLLSSVACGGSSTQPSSDGRSTTPPTTGTWTLVWSDDFSGANGTAPDPTKWVIETGGNGWGNNELEYYTNRTENVHQQDGNLVVTAIKEDFTGNDGVTRNYTSARLKTAGKFDQAYGKFEARIKLPAGQGMWPAFWMLGNNIDTVGWPTCGEIDIMENVGKEASSVHGTLHGPGYSGAAPLTSTFTLSNGQRFSDDFHIFAVEWELNTIRFYVTDSSMRPRPARRCRQVADGYSITRSSCC